MSPILSHQSHHVININVAENDGNKPVNGINIIPTTIITIDENIISEANWRSLKGAFRSVARARTIRTIATKNSSCTFLLQEKVLHSNGEHSINRTDLCP